MQVLYYDILVKCMKYKIVYKISLKKKPFNFRPLGSGRPKPQEMEGEFPLCFE